MQLGQNFDDDGRLALAQARLAVATERELMVARERGCPRADGVRWIGERNEVAACAALATASRARLAEIPGELAGDMTPNRHTANVLLRGERQVLLGWVAFVAEVTPLLPGATRWDLRRLGASASGRLLGAYLRQLAAELP